MYLQETENNVVLNEHLYEHNGVLTRTDIWTNDAP